MKVLEFITQKREAILILGMHRSGTSALTRVINLLGFDLPSCLVDGNVSDGNGYFANQTGYWESSELVHIHDHILSAYSNAWDDVFQMDKECFLSRDANKHRLILSDYVVKEFAGSKTFLLKDPRLCKLLPFWLDVLGMLNIQLKIVIPFRNPLEVAGSLKTRDRFSKEKSFLLWLQYVLEAEHLTRHLPRCFVNYRDLLANYRQVIDRISILCQVTWPFSPDEVGVQIERFLDMKHYRQRSDDAALCDLPTPNWVSQTYSILNCLAQPSSDIEFCYSQLDNIYNAVAYADSLYSKVIADKQHNKKPMVKAKKRNKSKKNKSRNFKVYPAKSIAVHHKVVVDEPQAEITSISEDAVNLVPLTVQVLPVESPVHLANHVDNICVNAFNPRNNQLVLQFQLIPVFNDREIEGFTLSVPDNFLIELPYQCLASPIMGEVYSDIPWAGQSRFKIDAVVDLPENAFDLSKLQICARLGREYREIAHFKPAEE